MKIIALILAVGLMAISLPAIAEDGNNWVDNMGNILTGKSNTYFLGGIGKKIEIDSKFFLMPDEVLVGAYTKIECSKPLRDSQRYYEGGGFVFALY